jgi:hypothetical protein
MGIKFTLSTHEPLKRPWLIGFYGDSKYLIYPLDYDDNDNP